MSHVGLRVLPCLLTVLGCTTALDAGRNSLAGDAGARDGAKDAGDILPGLSGADLVLNGSARLLDGGGLELVPDVPSVGGSTFLAEPVAIDATTKLRVYFVSRISGGVPGVPADGLAFVLHADPRGARALGRIGGGMGYETIVPSVAVELDVHAQVPEDLPSNHVEIVRDGALYAHTAGTAQLPLALAGERPVHTWIDVDVRPPRIAVFVSDAASKPMGAVLESQSFDVLASLGPSVFLGFTASTGMLTARHELLDARVWRE